MDKSTCRLGKRCSIEKYHQEITINRLKEKVATVTGTALLADVAAAGADAIDELPLEVLQTLGLDWTTCAPACPQSSRLECWLHAGAA
jgi:hypothetical protein